MNGEKLDNAFCVIINSETKEMNVPMANREEFLNIKDLVLRLVSLDKEGLEDFKFDPNTKKYYTVTSKRISSTEMKIEYHEETIVALKLIEALNEVAKYVTDHTTNLTVKGKFYEDMIKYLKELKIEEEDFGIVMIDADDFKNINETYGHMVGDDVLKELGRRVTKVIRVENAREQDLIGRFGGEEFVFLLKNISQEELHIVADRIRTSVFENREGSKETPGLTVHPSGGKDIVIPMTLSVGCMHSSQVKSVLKSHLSKLKNKYLFVEFCDNLIAYADLALRVSKEQGKNRVTAYDEKLKLKDVSSIQDEISKSF